MITKAEALNTSGLAFDLIVKQMEAEIDGEIKKWRGGRITIKLNRNGITDQVVDALIEKYKAGGWTVTRSTVEEGMQWDPYKVPVLVLS